MSYRTHVHNGARGIFAVFLFTALFAHMGKANSYIVRSTADAGVHSLRWAITKANINPGLDVITFDIEGDAPFLITPLSPLPPLTDTAGTVIDGISQHGATAGSNPPSTLNLLVRIDGSQAGAASGFWLLSSNNLLRGLVITGFQEDGIRIQGTAACTHTNEIRHCIIGMSTDGSTPQPNGRDTRSGRWGGIHCTSVSYDPGTATGNTFFQNLISGNEGDGILLSDSRDGRVTNNTIDGNFIGTDINGTLRRGNARNGILIYGGSSNNTVRNNIIGGNLASGIHLVGEYTRTAFTHNNRITKNHIGVSPSLDDIGNTRNGIYIGGPEHNAGGGFTKDNTISSNIIARNGRTGITVIAHDATPDNTTGNRLSQNSIFANRGSAIDVVKAESQDHNSETAGEKTDIAWNTPEFNFLEAFSGVTVLRGSIRNMTSLSGTHVELYRYRSFPASPEDMTLYVGSATPDGAGSWAYSTTRGLAAGDSIIALVIDADGNTSNFTVPHVVNMGGGYSMNAPPKSAKAQNAPRRIASLSEAQIDVENGASSFTVTVEEDCWGIMEVFTPSSELVSTLVDRWLPAGSYTITWDGTNWRGDRVEAGTYLCRLDAAGASHNITVSLQ